MTIVIITQRRDDSFSGTSGFAICGVVLVCSWGGVSKSVLNIVDYKASLPLLGDVNSLNVSVACGAFLYETIRQRSL